jgi:hypothetical protein
MAVGAARICPPAEVASPTTGACWSFGSRILISVLAAPVSPSASVAVATTCIRPGAPAVMVARPCGSSATGLPSTIKPSAAMFARLDAATCTTTDCPGIAGKLGVSAITTFGSAGVTTARMTTAWLALNRPSLTRNVTT